MGYVDFETLNAAVSTPENIEKTINYLADCLRNFLRPREQMLICFPDQGDASLGNMLMKAVTRVEGVPVYLGDDMRWKNILRRAFASRATAVAAPPLVVLGLSKLAKYTGTPLSIRNVLLAGYPALDWILSGIRRGLDCQIWGLYGPRTGGVISGFCCQYSRGIHLREDTYRYEVVDKQGQPLPEGSMGDVVISLKEDPALRLLAIERGRLDASFCACGNPAPCLVDIEPGRKMDPVLTELGKELHYWSSILDCRLSRGPSGLEMEIIRFPGEKLPKLPTCARQIVRPWDPDRDAPFLMVPGLEN